MKIKSLLIAFFLISSHCIKATERRLKPYIKKYAIDKIDECIHYLDYYNRTGVVLDNMIGKEENKKSPFSEESCDDVGKRILSFLPTQDLVACSHTSPKFYTLINRFDRRHDLLAVLQIQEIDFTPLKKIEKNQYSYDPLTDILSMYSRYIYITQFVEENDRYCQNRYFSNYFTYKGYQYDKLDLAIIRDIYRRHRLTPYTELYNHLLDKKYTKEQIKNATNKRTIDFILAHRPLYALLTRNRYLYDHLLDLYRVRIMSLYETPIIYPIMDSYAKKPLGNRLSFRCRALQEYNLIAPFVKREEKLRIILHEILAPDFDLLLPCLNESPLDVLPYFFERDLLYDNSDDPVNQFLQDPKHLAVFFGLLAKKYDPVTNTDTVDDEMKKVIQSLNDWCKYKIKPSPHVNFNLVKICENLL
ncbi:MAG: F-box protein, partial [Bacteroidota bacterium]